MKSCRVLLLCAAPREWEWSEGGVEVVAPLSGYPYYKRIEAAGTRYEVLRRRRDRGKEEKEEEEEEEEEEEAKGGAATTESKEKEAQYEQKRHKRLVLEEDYYELLGLGNLRWRATQEDIKRAHKKLILTYHPDKNEKVDDEIFKKITTAHETLSNVKKRRAYDSQEYFNDEIPTGTEQNFYQVFEEAFERFSKWSTVQPTPSFGKDATPYEDVKKFYSFWYSFKSWRDFSYEDEFDLNEAESREEKRWMERQNERERKKKKREEMSTIMKLVETAEKNDPRLKRKKQEIQEQKRLMKEAKLEAARKIKEEEERQRELELQRKEEEERKREEERALLKKKKIAENKKLRKLRSKFRSSCQASFTPPEEDVELICSRCTLDEMSTLVKTFESGNNEACKEAFQQQLKEIHAIDKKKQEPEPPANKKQDAPVPSKQWTEEELSQLTKALMKFPVGTRDRWQQVAEFLGTRSAKEVISKVKETKSVPTKSTGNEDAFDRFNKGKKAVEISSPLTKPEEATANNKVADWTIAEQKLLEKALVTFPATMKDRWDRIAEAIPGRSKKECILRYKFLVAQIKEKKAKEQKS